MIDTIRLSIPLTEAQHTAALRFVAEQDTWHWAMHNPKSGDMLLRHFSGKLPHNFDSHHRELRFTVDPNYLPEKSSLTVECSMPKLWYGHNIHLLYDWQTALESMRSRFNNAFNLHGKNHLQSVHSWIVNRVDVCYAYRFPNQRTAQSFLDSLKCLKYPYKTPIVYPTSIFFKGTTYSLKFYLKYPEFRKHDMQGILKSGGSVEWVEHLESLARGVFRVEATLRAKYLRRQNITTVADLAEVKAEIELRGIDTENESEKMAAIIALASYHAEHFPGREVFDGMVLEPPSDAEGYRVECGDRVYEGNPVSITIRKVETPTKLIQVLLGKFVGEGLKMRSVDKVKEALLEHYKPVKAARLTAFWLYFRQFGAQKTRGEFGKNSYYVSVAQIKKAGVSMVETPESKDETDRGFLDSFTLVIPSPYATNHFDDFQDSGNVLNLPIAR